MTYKGESLYPAMVTPEQLDIWRLAPSETQALEFKEASNQYDNKKLYKYCVAIANEGGGHFILGVQNHPPRQVIGTSAFNNPVDMMEKIRANVGFRVDIEEVIHSGKRVLVFVIPSRPRGTAYHFGGAYLMRCGQELVPMSEDKLRAIFNEGKVPWLETDCVSGVSDQDVVELLDTQKFFELIGLPYPTNRQGVLERLSTWRLVHFDGSRYSINKMGVILFAKDVKNFPELERKCPRITVYAGSTNLATKTTKFSRRGFAVNFQSIVNFVSEQLPQNEVIENTLRKEVKLIPDIALRELFSNAMIHQDFDVTGRSLDIEVFSDRVEITNPGSPQVPCDRFIDSQHSRNDQLADIMRKLGICEERGMGVDKVIDCAEALQLPPPNWREGFGRTIVTVFGPQKFDAMYPEDRVRACYQHCALKFVMNQRMTNESLRTRFQLPEGKSGIVTKIISSAVDAGIIRQDDSVGGSRRYAKYLPYWG